MMDVVTLCKALIEIDSINPFRAHREEGHWHIEGREQEMLAYCEGWLRDCGFAVERQACGGGRENLLASKGEGSRSLLLYAHVDTVEVKEGWTREEALSGRLGRREVDGREQEVLYGLGSNDMKGGVAVILCAARAFAPKNVRLKVALGCDEESWSLGSHCLVHESDFLEDVFGILVPELGESTKEPEPTQTLVTLGRCGRAEYLVDVPGTGGHGAEPERSDRVNALSEAAKIALAIEEYSRALPVFVPFGGEQEVKASALVTALHGGQGTLSIPDHAKLTINRVLVPGESEASAKEDLEALLARLYAQGHLARVFQGEREVRATVNLRERPTPSLAPYLCDPQEHFIKEVLQVLGRTQDVVLGMGVSVADENRFGAEAGKPVVVLGPRGEDSHAAYEWVTTESLIELEKLYGEILQHLDAHMLP